MVKNFLITICTFGLLFFFSQLAFACTCGVGLFQGEDGKFYSSASVAGSFSSSEAVFTGKVINIELIKEIRGGLIAKELEKPESLRNPKLRNLDYKLEKVTFEVIESFKGATEKKFALTATVYGCGYQFKAGESYLVYAKQDSPLPSKENAAQSEGNWILLGMRLKAEAAALNKQLPPYSVGPCSQTSRLSSSKEPIKEIRNFLKNGKWKEQRPVILY